MSSVEFVMPHTNVQCGDRNATHQYPYQNRHGKAPLNKAKTAMVKTAEQGKDRHGKAPLNKAKTAMVKTAEQGKDRHGEDR
ncbi:hypothetical protein NDU88_003048 [Pleurodeles waltl]|uniref:Uncharacterized protein n=1 Tax=Pleurodeles waltl TaxID=8319 RepID=A0AAV7VF87_PLEWA|nr:hypothetical protein NDU88_003048 [Pleurodeles waltl]